MIKVKLLDSRQFISTGSFEAKIESEIKDKKLIDIQLTATETSVSEVTYIVMIIYEE